MKSLFALLTVLSLISADLAFAKNKKKPVNNCRTAEEKQCLADTINGEARNQGYVGMEIVAKAVMTRLARGKYGSTICDITSGASFHRSDKYPTKGGPIDIEANANIKKATELGCTFGDMQITHFYRIGSTTPDWAKGKKAFPKANPYKHGNHYLFNAPMYAEADFEDSWEDMIMNPVYEQPENEEADDKGDGSIAI